MFFLRNFCCFFAILAIIALSTGQNYCKLCEEHVLCKPHYTKPVCLTKRWGLSIEQRKLIVNVHNKYRRKVASGKEKRGSPGPQPPAMYMPDLKWDKELAKIAQTTANTCRFGHDQCRNVDRFLVGQNIALFSTSDEKPRKLEDLVNMWYDEVAFFNPKQINRLTTIRKVGHYTQMLWAKTTKIGCGYVNYPDEKYPNTVYLVCNYGPAGNRFGESVYKIRGLNKKKKSKKLN